MTSPCRETLILPCSSGLCLRSKSESVIFCSVRKVAPVISSTWVTVSCSIHLWRTSKRLWTWSMSSVRLLYNFGNTRVAMALNTIGLIAAASTFLGVWFGHVAVRRLESVSPTIWLPTSIFAVVGIILEWLSLTTSSVSDSALFGILGITLLFDALEFTR